MKAIQIRYLPPTDNKGSRLKAWAEGTGQLIESLDYSCDGYQQHMRLARTYLHKFGWDNVVITGFGMLPNGDYVATLGSK